jgi:hypothetical protein
MRSAGRSTRSGAAQTTRSPPFRATARSDQAWSERSVGSSVSPCHRIRGSTPMKARTRVDDWTSRLTGLSLEQIGEARDTVESWDIEHVSAEICQRADIDASASACMLVSAFEVLKEHGSQESQLRAKLRGDRQTWSALTEILAGRSVLRFFDPASEIELDWRPGRTGPNADFRIREPGRKAVSIEFKSIGLSDVETAFFRRAAPSLPQLCPESGIATCHVAVENPHPIHIPSRAERRAAAPEDRRRRKKLPAAVRDLRGAVIAAHYTEQKYLERVRNVVQEALRQLHSGDECWVAIWWSNGASALSVQRVLSTIELPRHVLGVMVVGAGIAFPIPAIHYFDQLLPRDELLGAVKDLPVVSLEDHHLADRIFDAFEDSTGVRPTLLLDPHGIRGKRQTLLFRDGSRRIFPFNLLIDRDPPAMRRFAGSG